jgi:ferredoxin
LTAAVVRVRFEPSGREVRATVGERVLDAAENCGVVALPLACRAGNCGACLVDVPHGAAALAPAGEREGDTLNALAAPPGQRLACQLHVSDSAAPDELVVLSAARAPSASRFRRNSTS